MKNSRTLILFFLLCYLVAFVSGMLTRPEIPPWYAGLAKPTWRPPNWLFGPAWTILYGLMALAAWRVWRAPGSKRRTMALNLFGIQLALNFPWTPAFFALHLIRAAFGIIVLLLLCLLFFIVNARKVDRLAAALFVPYVFWICFAGALNYTIWSMNSVHASERPALPTAYALRLNEPLGAEALPSPASWEKAPAIQFDQDWKGENADPQRATEVRLLWTPDILYLRFHCNYRNIFLFPDARADGWRYELWDRDVAETFLQPDSTDAFVYREFEVSPNGYWIDLAVSHGKIEELHSGLRRRVVMDEKSKTWTAELAIPMKSLTTQFDPQKPWHANFYRIEGDTEPRFYSAWSPTFSPKPSFHVPSAFGTLDFRQ
ncbi:MAG: carbohydrate-binding family 9-like protein [Candidatus Acidiferrum sp.]